MEKTKTYPFTFEGELEPRPDLLTELIEDEVMGFTDTKKRKRILKIQNNQKKKLEILADKWDEIVEDL